MLQLISKSNHAQYPVGKKKKEASSRTTIDKKVDVTGDDRRATQKSKKKTHLDQIKTPERIGKYVRQIHLFFGYPFHLVNDFGAEVILEPKMAFL